jgi:hypothetical protein
LGLPVIHAERQSGDAHFCLEALYWCDFVGARSGLETIVIYLLELISQQLSKKMA